MARERLVLAYSGGLDTSVAVKWINETYGMDVIAYTCDLGYTITGPASATCSFGTWTAAPTCEPVSCAPNLVAPENGNVSGAIGVSLEKRRDHT